MSRPKESSKSLYAVSDTPAASGNQGETGLQRQAGQLLTEPKCNEAFASRMSTGGVETTDLEIRQAAHGGKDSMDKLNMNTDQAMTALDENPNEDSFTKLAEQDVDMAVSAAVKDTSLQTMALHGENKMLAERTRVGITGFGNA